mgnify:CR=1 FL=1
METKKDDNSIEQQIHNGLHQYLLSRGMVDERLPQAPDIEELWTKVGESYIKAQGITWPLFYTGVFYLAFVGLLTLLFRYIERRLSYFR